MLVEITEQSHDVKIYLPYGTDNNFTGKQVYKNAYCYVHKDALEKLEKAIIIANNLGYRFKILDAFRPQKAQEKLWDHTPDPMFLADPKKGSQHTRGVAIDLTLIDKKTGRELDMGTPFDDFTEQSFHGDLTLSKEAIQNRLTLLGIMSTAGFDFYFNEWWHYQLFKPREYPLILEGVESERMMGC
jgi:D-alanyl-D-alanine dipeptidase